VVVRNIAGLLVLGAVHFLADRANMVHRTGFTKISPYLFLLLLYGWIVFHNRVLFEKLYMQNRKRAYFSWTSLAMVLSSLNMHYILKTGFNVGYTLPHILSFWVYTVAGLGVYVIWRHLGHARPGRQNSNEKSADELKEAPANFSCIVDGTRHEITHSAIHYVESMENYIRIITSKKPLIVRLSLKEAEERLPVPPFLRISRSCIVNTDSVSSINGNSVTIHGQVLKVGKVFKKYVEDFLK